MSVANGGGRRQGRAGVALVGAVVEAMMLSTWLAYMWRQRQRLAAADGGGRIAGDLWTCPQGGWQTVAASQVQPLFVARPDKQLHTGIRNFPPNMGMVGAIGGDTIFTVLLGLALKQFVCICTHSMFQLPDWRMSATPKQPQSGREF